LFIGQTSKFVFTLSCLLPDILANLDGHFHEGKPQTLCAILVKTKKDFIGLGLSVQNTQPLNARTA
jgi:hypothetical protein